MVTLKNDKDNDFISKAEKSLKHSLRIKGIVIPVLFAIIVACCCFVLASPKVDIFPSGNHHDSLTTTAPTQTTEFNEDEYAHVIQD